MRRFNPPAGARRSALARCATGIVIGAAALAALAPPAQAGTMTNHVCRTPDGQPAGTSGWSGIVDNGAWEIKDTCASGGSLSVTPKSPGHSSDEPLAYMLFNPAPDTTVQSVSMRRAARLPFTSNTWGWSYTIHGGGGTIERNSAAQAPGGSASGGVGSLFAWNDPGNALEGTDLQNQLLFGMSCSGLGGQICADPANSAFLRVYAASIVTYDATDPSVSNVGGSLLSPGTKDGIETLTYNAADTGTGLYRAIVEVDGQAVQTTVLDGNLGRCVDAVPGNADPYEFSHPHPCKPTISSGEFSIDTRTMAEGERTIRVRIEDATGNRANVYGPMPITVDNVPPPTSASPPVVGGTPLRGSLLSTDAGGWNGHGVPVSFAYQWERSADDGISWAAIPGATSSTYTVGASDVGRHIRSRVTATSSEGTSTVHSASAGKVSEPAPPATLPADSVGRPGADGRDGTDGSDGRDGTPQTIVQTGNGRDASPTATLSAAFDGTRSRTIKVRYGKKRRIMGTLRLPDGRPVVGARLDVSSQAKLMGSLPRPAGQVVTDSHGRFAYALKATMSRTVTISYRWYAESSRYTHTTTVNVNVIPAVSMKASRKTLRNGQALSLTGSVKGAPKGVRKVVEIQALDGRRWRTIATVRVDRRKAGRFSYRYRFTRTQRPTSYRFRATVKAERGWPFLTGRSGPRTVKVLP